MSGVTPGHTRLVPKVAVYPTVLSAHATAFAEDPPPGQARKGMECPRISSRVVFERRKSSRIRCEACSGGSETTAARCPLARSESWLRQSARLKKAAPPWSATRSQRAACSSCGGRMARAGEDHSDSNTGVPQGTSSAVAPHSSRASWSGEAALRSSHQHLASGRW